MQERCVHVCNADSLAWFLADAFRISFAVHVVLYLRERIFWEWG